MHCLALLSTVSLALVRASSSSTSDELCMDQQPSQRQRGLSLLQARHESAGTRYVTSKFGVNPSGAAAPLDETGYAAVGDRCCPSEMKVFIERQVFALGMEVCDPAGLNGIVPYHSCDKGPQTFAALTSNLLNDSQKKCTWVASTGNCKLVDPGCPRFADMPILADCGCNVSKAVLLDFENAKVIQSNLGGKGPDNGAEELRYQNIAEYPPGQPFELVITTNDYVGTAKYNGKANGKFGRISIKGTGFPAGWSGNVKMQLNFVRPGTTTPVVLPEFFFAVFDVDANPKMDGRQTLSGKGYKGYVTDVDTVLVASKGADGSTKFTATQIYVANPSDPMTATKAQRQSMVMYFYENKASFEFTFGVESNGVGIPEKWFDFAGQSALMDRCGS